MKKEINIDDLIRSTVKDEDIQSPGNNFAERVMSSVSNVQIEHTTYKPLISGSILAGVICFIALIIALGLFFPSSQTTSLIDTTFLNKMLNYFNTRQFNIEIPGSISYIIISALLMIFLQAILISKFIRKTH